jgi:hypothetical protein
MHPVVLDIKRNTTIRQLEDFAELARRRGIPGETELRATVNNKGVTELYVSTRTGTGLKQALCGKEMKKRRDDAAANVAYIIGRGNEQLPAPAKPIGMAADTLTLQELERIVVPDLPKDVLIDAFLRDPSAARWDGFRAHMDNCLVMENWNFLVAVRELSARKRRNGDVDESDVAACLKVYREHILPGVLNLPATVRHACLDARKQYGNGGMNETQEFCKAMLTALEDASKHIRGIVKWRIPEFQAAEKESRGLKSLERPQPQAS